MTKDLVEDAVNLMLLAVVLHCVVSLVCFSNQNLAPSPWNSAWFPPISLILGWNQEDYSGFMEKWVYSDEKEKSRRWWDYVRARSMDLGREGCFWTLPLAVLMLSLLIGAVLLGGPIFEHVIGPVVRPIVDAGRTATRTSVVGVDDESMSFYEAIHHMKKTSMLTSYEMHHNPRYQLASDALRDTYKSIGTTRRETRARGETNNALPPEEIWHFPSEVSPVQPVVWRYPPAGAATKSPGQHQ